MRNIPMTEGKILKRFFALILAIACILSLAACGGNSIHSVEDLAPKANAAMIRLQGVSVEEEAFSVVPGTPDILHTFIPF